MASLRGMTQDSAAAVQEKILAGLNSDLAGTSVKASSSPDALAGPLVWSGAEFQGDSAYTLRLSEDEVAEVDDALASFKS